MAELKTIDKNGRQIAVVNSALPLFNNAQSAMDYFFTVQYQTGASSLAINKEALGEDFFDLRSGLAGEILQKCVNYHLKLGIFGDYSGYGSKALRDFMLESNQGRDFFFVASEEEAVSKLGEV